jgi:hypothetical protein
MPDDPLLTALLQAPDRRNPLHDLWDELATMGDFSGLTLPEQKELRDRIDRVIEEGDELGNEIEKPLGKLKSVRGVPAPRVIPGF